MVMQGNSYNCEVGKYVLNLSDINVIHGFYHFQKYEYILNHSHYWDFKVIRGELVRIIENNKDLFDSFKIKVREKDGELESIFADLDWIKNDRRASLFLLNEILVYLKQWKAEIDGSTSMGTQLVYSVPNAYRFFIHAMEECSPVELNNTINLSLHFLFFESRMVDTRSGAKKVFQNPIALTYFLKCVKINYYNVHACSTYRWLDFDNEKQCQWFVGHLTEYSSQYNLNISVRDGSFLGGKLEDNVYCLISEIDKNSQNLEKIELIHNKMKTKWSSQKSKLKKKECNLKPYNYAMSVDLEPKLNQLKKETGIDKEVLVEHAINAFYETYQQRRSITLPQGKKSYMYSMSYGFDGLLSEVQNKLGFEGDFGELIEAAIRYYAENYPPEVTGIAVGQVKR
ncbi:hypothetical protein C1S99_11900 [Vibrio parahaemolyticus]|nr:hypothetical protein C1T12_12385 [Vibrio parahaemolyticus]QLK44787.1 hypothetical protein DR996_05390 [Vibrio owensii]PMS63029.1 hypothetical protein C1S91_11280 [Vibrio parahaemolyticus]PMS68966.1 hypothetical protein C1S96_07470 [Vibrio parahaemolyticus]PMS73602.1 hypothetical protein C1T10_11515 [Vibrio parahaemolyticus]